uniref:Mitochondrial carrier domain-containing protein n=1 Tax=Rhabditophanes sp. KR3021 TaxID=114890 RepID=A0AC35TPN2_9BILA
MPGDVIKSKIQINACNKNNKIRDVAKFILKTEGPKGFFKGLFPVILKAIPSNIAYFVGYELALKTLDEL